jgi:hypothetical protein
MGRYHKIPRDVSNSLPPLDIINYPFDSGFFDPDFGRDATFL